MKIHCLFEQSGVFKNEFKKLGYEAFDYDIQNDYGETDYEVDLFEEIRGGYDGLASIFDNITSEDLILAFFPCTRFEAQILLGFRGDSYQMQKWTEQQKLAYDLKLHRELSNNYELITKLTMLVMRKNLRMVFENPYSEQHYLTRYWCIKPQVIDYDRRVNGDIFKKPTQYFFINLSPKNNMLFEPIEYVETKKVNDMVCFNSKTHAKLRSEIHPQYANRFIKKYLIDYEQDFQKLYAN